MSTTNAIYFVGLSYYMESDISDIFHSRLDWLEV